MSALAGGLDLAAIIQGALAVLLASVVPSVVIAIVRGALVPRRSLDDLRLMYDKLLADKTQQAAEWRQAYFVAARQSEVLMVTAQVAEATLNALPVDSSDASP